MCDEKQTLVQPYKTNLILFQTSANKKSRLLQHSFHAAMSNVVVRLIRSFVFIIFRSCSFPAINQSINQSINQTIYSGLSNQDHCKVHLSKNKNYSVKK